MIVYRPYRFNLHLSQMETKQTEKSGSIAEAKDIDVCICQLNGDGLYMNYRHLQDLPQWLFGMDVCAALQRLYLKHNILSSLPQDIGLLQNLTELYLGCNLLKTLPEELGELKQLLILGVSDNQLTELPSFVCRLKNLRRLQISKNRLTQFPPEIGGLSQLQSLEASHNCLRYVPHQLSQCHLLRQLSLDANQLTGLPRQLCQLPKLSEISACDNHLISIPQNLGRMVSLQALYVDNNPWLTAVPASILNKTVGFCGSGKGKIPENIMSTQQHVILSSSDEGDVVVPMPPEICYLGHMNTKCVLSLVELSLRVAHRSMQMLGLNVEDEDLPLDLVSLLQTPTAHCQNCSQEVFTAAFAVMFRAQVKTTNLLLLGLCCSSSCVRKCSLAVHLPLLYPKLEDLALALVLV